MIAIRDFLNTKPVTYLAVILASVPLVWILISFLTEIMIGIDGIPTRSPSQMTELFFAIVAITGVYSFIHLPTIFGSLLIWRIVSGKKIANFIILGFLLTTLLATLLQVQRFKDSIWLILD